MDLSAITITTERLMIVPVNEKYVEDIFRELTPEVSTYLSFDPTGKIEDTYAFIRNAGPKMKSGEDFPVVVVDTVTKEFIGCAGIHKIHSGKPELGIWLKKTAHGKGYGKEIIGGLIAWAIENLAFDYLYYPVAKANLRSKNVIESLGGTPFEEQRYTSSTGKVLDEIVYRISKTPVKDSQEGRRLHAIAEGAREAGDFTLALRYTDEAAIAYTRDHDLLGLSEVMSSRQSTFKQLYRATGDAAFLLLEKHAALAAVEIAEESKVMEALAIPYHNAGKYYFEAKEYGEAADYFKKAVDNLLAYPTNRHSRPSVTADIKGHQFAAEYQGGDKSALSRALTALDELMKSEEKSTYNKNAWVSGAYLRIAEMLVKDNPALSRQYLKKAEEIILSDERQVLRRRQLDKLKTIIG